MTRRQPVVEKVWSASVQIIGNNSCIIYRRRTREAHADPRLYLQMTMNRPFRKARSARRKEANNKKLALGLQGWLVSQKFSP